MPKFVELWVYLSATPLFGLTATLLVYVLAQTMYTRLHQAPWANPVLWTVLVLAAGLLLSGVPYPTYFAGAQFIHFLLGPAVVALAWPLWQRRAELRQRWPGLLTAAMAGGLAAMATPGRIASALARLAHRRHRRRPGRECFCMAAGVGCWLACRGDAVAGAQVCHCACGHGHC